MGRKTSQVDIVRAMGTVGFIGVLLTIISDFILIGRPSNAYTFLKLGTQSMADMSQWRITVGAFLGIIVLPFQILGLMPLYHGLKPAGRILPLIVVITTAHTLIMGIAFHISYAFIGSGWKLYYNADLGNIITTEIVTRFDFYWKLLVIIMFVELLFSSIIYVVIIMKGSTIYPKWMALLNPLCVLIILFPFVFILPAPIGGFIAPAYLNITTLVFFGFTTVFWKLKTNSYDIKIKDLR